VADLPVASFPLTTASNPFLNRLTTALSSMGHLPYYWITPDGYPDVKEAWSASTVMLTRWNLGLSLAGAGAGRLGRQLVDGFTPADQTPAEVTTAGAFVDHWTERLIHRALLDEDRAAVVAFLTGDGDEDTPLGGISADRRAATLALLLDSPYFQWR